jgi:ABC-2 type transport system ATP-binding protein
MIRVQNLSKSFQAHRGLRWAVNKVSFSVEPGEILAFLGPNGAGKSTTMKMMTGFLAPDDGTVKFGPLDVVAEPRECQRHIGYVPENAPLYQEMTVTEFLRFCHRTREARENFHERFVDVVKACHLDDVIDERIENLSKGYKRRVSIAQALIHDPQFLILDEPTDGLDPNQKQQIRNLLRAEARRGKTVVISTHILEEVEALCDRVVLIADGEVKFSGTTAEFRAQAPSGRLDDVFGDLTRSVKEVVHA